MSLLLLLLLLHQFRNFFFFSSGSSSLSSSWWSSSSISSKPNWKSYYCNILLLLAHSVVGCLILWAPPPPCRRRLGHHYHHHHHHQSPLNPTTGNPTTVTYSSSSSSRTQKTHGRLLGSKISPPNTAAALLLLLLSETDQQIQQLVDLLRNCAKKRSIKEGKTVHGLLLKSYFRNQDKTICILLNNHIAHMYTKCLDFDAARRVFDEMPQRNVFSWTGMIVGSIENGLYLQGFKFFCEMLDSGIQPDKFTYSSVFQSCVGVGSVDWGKMVHAQILKTGFFAHVFVGTSLLNMYAKCGEIEESVRVFNTMGEHNQVSWNAMISGFTWSDLHLEAYKHFLKMKKEGVSPNMTTFASILKSVGKLNDVTKGREVHNYVTELGVESNVQVGTALIDMYSKCGCLNNARLVFDTNFTDCKQNLPWNAMISGYSQGGRSKEALELFTKMRLNNVEPDVFTFTSAISAVATWKHLKFGREVHALVAKYGYDSRFVSVSNALADAYSKCGSLDDARMVFERMEDRDLVSWTTMVTAHATCKEEEEKALEFFSQMREEGFTPNRFTFASVLVAVSSLCFLEYGRQVHGFLCKAGLDSHECIESALIDMYAKCGSISDAEKAFENIITPDVVSWTAIISGYAQHGFAKKALEIFRRMEESGMKANAVTLLCVLFACSHGGMVDEGLHYFQSMRERYGLVPEMEHYACIVDLLGRVGRLDDAEDFINSMPIEPTDMVWQTLLGACRVHGNVELGERAAEKILTVRPEFSATYVLLSNTYMEKGNLEDGLSLRNAMKNRGVKKEPGFSWISVDGEVHKFFSWDQQHPQKEKIYAKLEELRKKMKTMGYVPKLRYSLQEVE